MPDRLLRHRPAAPLDTYVECFWWSRRDTLQPFCEHMLPSGSAQLIFALHEAPILCVPGSSSDVVSWSRGVLHGPQWNYFISGPKPRGAVVGVSFRPGAAGAVLGLPVTEFADRHIPIEEVWGARGRALHERLLAAMDPTAVFGILERELSERLEGPLRMHPAVLLGLSPHVQRLQFEALHRAVPRGGRAHPEALLSRAAVRDSSALPRVRRCPGPRQRRESGRTRRVGRLLGPGASDS
jgi:hypothetical protein